MSDKLPHVEAHEAMCKSIGDMAKENDALKGHIKRLEEALEECDWAFTKFCPEHESRYGDAWEKVRDALNRPNPFKPYWPEENL